MKYDYKFFQGHSMNSLVTEVKKHAALGYRLVNFSVVAISGGITSYPEYTAVMERGQADTSEQKEV